MNDMKLDKLIETREKISSKEFPIPVKELCARYEALFTGVINDVLREYCLMDQALPAAIAPLRDEMKVAGIAFTIKSSQNTQISGEMETRAKMLDEIHEDAVCIWDSSRATVEAALWGEVTTTLVKRKGGRGAVCDGGCRDTAQILAQNFPVFCRYRISSGSLGRNLIIGFQVPIQIGNTTIRPGDVVFGDIDGVIIVPRDIAYDVVVRAEEIGAKEEEYKDWVNKGESASEIIDKGGYF